MVGGVGKPAASWRATNMCCDARAAVGASTTAVGSQLAPNAASAEAESRCKIGNMNISVLPDPVCETTRTSRPLTASGSASA